MSQWILRIFNASNPGKLYFTLLPTELLTLLLIKFNSTELLTILPQIEKISDFDRLIKSKTFWKLIWKRDISSFLSLPDNPYEKYKEIFNDLSLYKLYTYKDYERIDYLAYNGYDRLLLRYVFNKDEYNEAMRRATEKGHIEIVKLMLDLGADDYNLTMAWAASRNYTEIVKLLLEKGADNHDINYNWVMSNAAYIGNLEIVKLMLEKGANSYNGAMTQAAHGGHIEIVKLMLELGADDYYKAWREAKTEEIRDLIKSYKH